MDGGEACPLTTLEQGVSSGPAWSPDGARLAFTAGPPGERLDRDKPFRVTRPVYRYDELGFLRSMEQELYVVAVEGGEPTRLTHDGFYNSQPQWSPDGRELLFLATMFPDSFRSRATLRVVTLDGETRDLIAEWGSVVAAAWLPDGERIVFVGQPHARPIGSKSDVWVVSRTGGAPACRTAGLEVGIGSALQSDMPPALTKSPRLLPDADGQHVFLTVQEGGTMPIFRVVLDGEPAWEAVITGERSAFPLSLEADKLLFLASTLDDPTTLFLAAPDGTGERRLTRLNEPLLARRSLPRTVPLAFRSADETPVEGWLLLPPTGEPPFPTILYIHGGPHSGFGHIFSFDFQMLAGAGFAVLIVNQRGSTGYGDAFATQIIGDWGNLDYEDLMAGVDFAIQEGHADGERLGCCGLSGGGNLSCWIVGHTDRFKAAVPENPVTNWVSFYGVSDIGPWFAVEELGGAPHEIPEVYHRCSPISYAHRCTTPTLLIQGTEDYRCPPEQSEQFYTTLRANGCPAELLYLPGGSHAGAIRGAPPLRRAQNEALLGWMKRWIVEIRD